MTDTTRYLCSAPYLDVAFANTVIEEVVEDEHRAVAPSWDFDLDPVVRHCYRARRLLLARDALVAAVVIVGLCLSPLVTIAWLLVGVVVLGWQSRWTKQVPTRTKVGVAAAILAAALLLVCCGVLGSTLTALLSFGETGSSGDDPFAPDQPALADQAIGGTLLVAPLVLALVAFGVLFAFRLKGYHVITNELAVGRSGPHPGLGNERIAQRMATVAAAQYGNVVYQAREPFLGTGVLTRAWSFAHTLRHRTPVDPLGVEPPALPLDELGPALNRRIRETVEQMRGEHLPGGVRIPNLYLVPFLVADGVRVHKDPLLHPTTLVPYTLAHPDAVHAIMRCPQAGMRYYERVVVGGQGKPVFTASGQLVLPPQHLGIDISAFVHVAVEGGRLYTEFISTVMPPVMDRYTLADTMRPERAAGWALRDTLLFLPADTTASGWRAARTLWRMASGWWRMEQAHRASQELRVYDYGARASTRQLAAEPAVDKFLQQLDDLKYGKLIERAVTEAIVECLAESGYDTAEFSEHVNHVQNVNIYGGQQAFGSSQPTFQQHNQPGSANR